MKIKNIFKKIVFLKNIQAKIEEIEYRSFNRRFYAVEQAAEYLVNARIPGDYLEFGVFKGATFTHAFKWLASHFPKMKFFAFDSFEGLPKPRGVDNKMGYSGNFHENEFACSKEEFLEILKKEKVDLKRIKIIEGWFDKTLKSQKAKEYGLDKIAVVWIDCDLYKSTVPILKFITPYLMPGTVIIFDDWRSFRNNPKLGEQKACREWLRQHPKVKLAELFSYGCCGIAFTVTSC